MFSRHLEILHWGSQGRLWLVGVPVGQGGTAWACHPSSGGSAAKSSYQSFKSLHSIQSPPSSPCSTGLGERGSLRCPGHIPLERSADPRPSLTSALFLAPANLTHLSRGIRGVLMGRREGVISTGSFLLKWEKEDTGTAGEPLRAKDGVPC